MNDKVDSLVKALGLRPHPEGGYFSETYRSPQVVSTARGERQLMTAIYFLLTSENPSKFHRIQSDELWFFHEGSPLTVHVLDEEGYHPYPLGPAELPGHQPFLLVKAGQIFGSTVEEQNAYSLVSCVVAPGFDFRDFDLFQKEALMAKWPEHKDIIERLT